jgi:multisubunit Na+/H+ antiporter MnhG subunit
MASLPTEQKDLQREMLVVTKDSTFKTGCLGIAVVCVLLGVAISYVHYAAVAIAIVLVVTVQVSLRSVSRKIKDMGVPEETRDAMSQAHRLLLAAVWCAAIGFYIQKLMEGG